MNYVIYSVDEHSESVRIGFEASSLEDVKKLVFRRTLAAMKAFRLRYGEVWTSFPLSEDDVFVDEYGDAFCSACCGTPDVMFDHDYEGELYSEIVFNDCREVKVIAYSGCEMEFLTWHQARRGGC